MAEVLNTFLATRSSAVRPRWRPKEARVVGRLLACRTPRLGGHRNACSHGCGHDEIAYNSCRDRHCPKCQGSAQGDWLAARQADVLPVPYAHVVFTLPASLRTLARARPDVLYDRLMRTAASTLSDVAANPRHLGARIGFFAVLHTWGQTLTYHPHVHCVIPAGGLAPDAAIWKACRPGFFLPVRVLSRLFRGRMLSALREAFAQGAFPHVQPNAFNRALQEAADVEWVVYSKPPFHGPNAVLAYLARYTHRVAISNHRILAVDPESVTFLYKSYRSRRTRRQLLSLSEFVRRFLLHVLPIRFMRIRYYGFMANGCRRRMLPRCRAAITGDPDPRDPPATPSTSQPQALGPDSHLLPVRPRICPACGRGFMRIVQVLERPPPLRRWSRAFA